MALITCPKCGKQFSEHAKACPLCGASREEIDALIAEKIRTENKEAEERSNRNLKVFGIICLVTVLSVIGYKVYDVAHINFAPIEASNRSELTDYLNQHHSLYSRSSYRVKIPSGVTYIEGGAFSDALCPNRFCDRIVSVDIPRSVTRIGSGAFANCEKLKSILITSSVEEIGNNAFWCCSSLASIKVEKGNRMYDSRCDCNAIIETASNVLVVGSNATVIPSSVTSIGNGAFCGRSGLTSLTIPSSVTYIGKDAFKNCSSLTSLTIPSSVTYIGKDAFGNCPSLILEIPKEFQGQDDLGDCKEIIYY